MMAATGVRLSTTSIIRRLCRSSRSRAWAIRCCAPRRGRSSAREIKSPAVQKLIDDMIETMVEYHGVGLAAPQVHEGLRALRRVARCPTTTTSDGCRADRDHQPGDHRRSAARWSKDWEGCLSIPDIRGRVPRAREIKVRALRSARASASSFALHDFPARVVQHETDHLDGILFFDRMRSFESLTFLDEYARYWTKD